MTGVVYLVGGGPGDPGLLTSKAKRLIEEADAIVYDRLVSPRLLSLARTGARAYYVGKESSHHTVRQEGIEALLIELARAEKSVVRLKGGDPFVFGRGGEEAMALGKAGIAWEVVPGISSAIAVPAYAGIPVTHRDVSPSFTVVTGHRTLAEELGQVDAAAGGHNGTLVILMGVAQIRHICRILMEKGRDESTPVAVIRSGTRSNQEALVGDLGTIADRVEQTGFRSPAIIIVGEVVRMRQTLSWFEEKPLFGRKMMTVAETRMRAAQMADELEALGAEVLDVSLEHLWARSEGKIQRLATTASEYGGIFFSTAISVGTFFGHLKSTKRDIRRILASVRFAALDSHVADALWAHGIAPDVVLERESQSFKVFDNHSLTSVETLTSKNATEQVMGFTRGMKSTVPTPKLIRWIEEITRTGQNVFVEQGLAIHLSPVAPTKGGVLRVERLLEPCLDSPLLPAIRDFAGDGPVDIVWDSENAKRALQASAGNLLDEAHEVVENS